MATYQGPSFRLIDTITREQFAAQGGLVAVDQPFLVRGGVTDWPAWGSWSFDHFADLARDGGSKAIAIFQNGLVEQGDTRQPVTQPLEPYMRQLGGEAAANGSRNPDVGLCKDRVLEALAPGETFHLDWDYLRSFQPNKVYLAQWDIIRQFPELRNDLRLARMWRFRRNYPFIWIGPANTITGLHTDYPDNWFCQFRGEKEFVLFTRDDDRFLSPSPKYDFGAVLSSIDVMHLADTPEGSLLSRAHGIYARVRPGDAMFVPKNTWHFVTALEPAISLSVFGLTLADMVLQGPWRIGLDVCHKLGLYRRGNCTCHGAGAGRY
jgi:lysine-specific demethylase 8